MKKILFVATIPEHFHYFHLPYFKYFKELGWQTDVACRDSGRSLENCDNIFDIPIDRIPFSKSNITAYKKLKKIINENNYDIVHCHTPMGGVLARLAARKSRRKGTKVLYTAHGFHFCKGSPTLNWCIYFPIELFLSRKTDCLITINDEDFSLARKYFHAKKIEKVNGVGYNCDRYFPVDKEEKSKLRKKLGYSDDEKLLIYVAELNENKNQRMLIKALNEVLKKEKNARLILCGEDNNNENCKKLACELGIENKIDFLGHVENIDEYFHISDICVGSSYREGLPVNVMEALACALPVVLSDNRGHRVLCRDGENGFLVKTNDYEKMAESVCKIIDDKDLYEEMSENAVELVKPYSKEVVFHEMKRIYLQYIRG